MTEENKAMVKTDTGVTVINPPRLSVEELKENVQTIKRILKEVMKEEVHYGKIPGCKKPSLYKPGAEKLAQTFRITINTFVEDLSTDDEARYRITASAICRISNMSLGTAVAECSSNEEKFKWREALCDDEFADTLETQRRIKYKRDYKTKKITKEKQIRVDKADKANTILRMSEKRAFVALTLRVTAASDVFDVRDNDPVMQGAPKDATAVEDPHTPKDPKPKKTEEIHECHECGSSIPENVYEFTMSKYKKALCYPCQEANA